MDLVVAISGLAICVALVTVAVAARGIATALDGVQAAIRDTGRLDAAPEHPYVAKLRQAGVLGDVAVPPKQAEDLGPV